MFNRASVREFLKHIKGFKMRGIPHKSLETYHTLIVDDMSGRHKYIGTKNDKYYLVDGFGTSVRVVCEITKQDADERVQKDLR